MNKRTGLLCRLGLHRWCKHPTVESKIYEGVVFYICNQCRCDMEHDPITGRFLPVEDIRVCVRCQEVRR